LGTGFFDYSGAVARNKSRQAFRAMATAPPLDQWRHFQMFGNLISVLSFHEQSVARYEPPGNSAGIGRPERRYGDKEISCTMKHLIPHPGLPDRRLL
jgi:hypothetical protein